MLELARRAPLLPDKDVLAFVDIDSMQKRVYGHHKQGAAFGHTKIQGKSLLVRGLNALAATISTAGRPGDRRHPAARRQRQFRPWCRVVCHRSGHAARATGCTGTLVVRADSAIYSAAFTGAVRRAGAFFSVTVAMNRTSGPRSRRSVRTPGGPSTTPGHLG